jgi:enoyl-CoA hydratase/carnithine racemase
LTRPFVAPHRAIAESAKLPIMSDELVLRSDVDGVATLTLNRPDKLNAMHPAAFVVLRGHIDAIATDPTVRCVVLTGAGRSFCAGHDLGAIADHDRAPSKHFESETVDALENLPMPTIAMVRGHCLTGGLEIALGCDMIVATETAVFGDTHGQWGLVPIWGMSVRLPERVGRSMSKRLMFTSSRISGVEAARIGLADQCVPDDQLDAAVQSLTAAIVANSADSNRIIKRLLSDHADLPRSTALLHERELPHGRPSDMAERLRARKR